MSALSHREQETLSLINKYRAEHPEATLLETYKATNTNAATYHVAKRKSGLIAPKKYTKKPVMHTMVVPEPAPAGHHIIIVAPDLRATLKELLGG